MSALPQEIEELAGTAEVAVEVIVEDPTSGEQPLCPDAGQYGHRHAACTVCQTREAWAREYGREKAAGARAAGPGGLLDLTPYLDGTYAPPVPSVGLRRVDGAQMLYPGRWHTMIGPTESGKSLFAAAHLVAEIQAGNDVVYAHFEEATPAGTLQRLLKLGLTATQILEHLHWLDGRLTLEMLTEQAGALQPSLVILDGILAACASYGWDPVSPMGVGGYKNLLVNTFTAQGAAVLSLGHAPKGHDRQEERDGFGSVSWLAEVDGVGFRLRPGKSPIRRGKQGCSGVHVVKDRDGMVALKGNEEEAQVSDGWTLLGSFWVDDTSASGRTRATMTIAAPKDDPERMLAEKIAQFLQDPAVGGQFTSANVLGKVLKKNGIAFNNSHLKPALEVLEAEGRLTWPEVAGRQARPGWLSELGLSTPAGLVVIVEDAQTAQGR
jgi:hypothetical protein